VQFTSVSDRTFRHPIVDTQTAAHGIMVHLRSPGIYLWRVQAQGTHPGASFTAPKTVRVAPLRVPPPGPLTPHNGAVLTTSNVRLCWRPVRDASSYRLSIHGRSRITVRSSCTVTSVRPGAYTWQVAAVSTGFGTSVSALSQAARFTVRAAPTSVPVIASAPSSAPVAIPTPTPIPQPVIQAAVPTPTPVPLQSVPVQSAPTQSAPVQSAPVQPSTSTGSTSSSGSSSSGSTSNSNCIPFVTC
jgi:hypothetical protein